MQRYPYEDEAFRAWCYRSFIVTVVLGFFLPPLFVCACIVHILLYPAYWHRDKLGHPSWVMAASLLPTTIAFTMMASYAAPRWLHTPTGLWTSLLAPVALWLPFLLYKPTKFKAVVLILGLAVVLMVYFADINGPRGQFLQDLDRIERGMAVEQVDRIMGDYSGWQFPAGSTQTFVNLNAGQHPQAVAAIGGEATLVGKRIYRHTIDGASNADRGIVIFENNRVMHVEFSPD